MATISIRRADGTTQQIDGQRFSYKVQDTQFWFFLHESLEYHSMTITHCDSGKRVVDVTYDSIIRHNSDEKAAAKMELDKLIERVGAARVRSVLAAG